MSHFAKTGSVANQSHTGHGVVCKKLSTPICRSHLTNTNTSNSISVLYFNARSLRNKYTDLEVLLKSDAYDLIFISETWLKDTDLDSTIVDSKHYNIIRNDRNTHAGGVAAIFNTKLTDKIVTSIVSDISGFEIVSFKFYFSSYMFSTFVCVYLPPQSSRNLSTVLALVKTLKSCIGQQDVYILGDFNFNNCKWDNNFSSCSRSFREFNTFLEENHLSQLVTTATHISGNILDLVITSNPQSVSSLELLEPFTSTCDHNMIALTLTTKTINKPQEFPDATFI